MTKTVVVTGIAGAQQSAVAQTFAQGGWTVRGTARQSSEEHGIPIMIADLESGSGLDAAFTGAEAVAFTLPQNHRQGAMTQMARMVAAAAGRQGVRRLVVNTAAMIDETADTPLAIELRAVREAVQSGSVPSVTLQPTVFMDNLRAPWSLPAIVGQGVLAYPAPEDARISWISHKSLAEFVVAAATLSGDASYDLRIGGPVALTGPEVAAVLSEALSHRQTYVPIPLEAFAASMNEAMGAPSGDRLASFYRGVEAKPDWLAVENDGRLLREVVPESFEQFVARHDWSPPRP